MTPAPPAASRIAPLACALAATALVLSGCGDGSASTAESSGATRARASGKARTAAGGCPSQVGAFVKSLDALRRQLAVGLSYEQYAARVKALRSSYGKLPIDRLAIDCLNTSGTPAEAALNEYIDATNAWGDCLADPACTTAGIEPVLQRRWRLASGFLSEARAG